MIFSIGIGIGVQFTEDKSSYRKFKNNETTIFKTPTDTKSSLSVKPNNFTKKTDMNYKNPKSFNDVASHKTQKKYAYRPLWLDNAVPFLLSTDIPLISIVLDDMGLNRRRSEEAVKLSGPLTLSYLSYASNLIQQTRLATANGHELLLHLPMEPDGNENPGPAALLVSLKEIELRKRLNIALERFPNFIGINNHMGSRFTADLKSMTFFLTVLKEKGYLFLDSLTTRNSVALELGKKFNTPVIARDVFLDDVDDEGEVWLRLAQAERIATKTGTAIAIGHPRKATLKVLKEWINNLNDTKIKLVPLSTVAQIRLKKSYRKVLKE